MIHRKWRPELEAIYSLIRGAHSILRDDQVEEPDLESAGDLLEIARGKLGLLLGPQPGGEDVEVENGTPIPCRACGQDVLAANPDCQSGGEVRQ